MRVNPYIAGNPISGGNGFFGRSDIFREVMQVLRHPQHNAIVLYGQRRIGKTSVLYQLEQQLAAAQEFTPVYFDLQDKADKSLSQVLAELAQKIAHVVGLAAPDTALFDAEGEYFRQQFLPQAATHRELVLLFDEFDVLDSPQQNQAGQAFFPYLRRWMADIKRVHFVFVIGRRPEDLSTNTVATFKGVRATRVSRLSPENAAKVVRQSEQNGSLDWSPEAVEQVWAWSQGHPYFTQLLCSVVWEQMEETEGSPAPATAAQVDKAVDQALQQGANAFYWIWEGLPPAERVVMAAMAEVTEEVITRDRLVETLNQSGVRLIVRQLELAPDTLVEWDVLQPIQDGYRFTVPLLRRWVVKNRPLRRVKEELDRLDPLAEDLFRTGQRFYGLGRLEAAQTQLRQAIQVNPNHLKARLLLGQILLGSGGLNIPMEVPTTIGPSLETVEEAVKILEEVYQYDPDAARSELVRALLALSSRQDETAQLTTLERILKIQPEHPIAKSQWESIKAVRNKTILQTEISDSKPIEHNNLLDENLINPFTFHNQVFVGYRNQVRRLITAINQRSSLLIIGLPQMGKTTLFREVESMLPSVLTTAYIWLYLDIEIKPLTLKDFWIEIGQRLSLPDSIKENFKTQSELDVKLNIFKELRDLYPSKKVIVAIDRFDLLIVQYQFIPQFFNDLKELALVLKTPLLLSSYYNLTELLSFNTSPDKEKSNFLDFVREQVFLDTLEPEEIQELIKRSLESNRISFTDSEIKFIVERAGGIPSLAKWVASAIFEEKVKILLDNDSSKKINLSRLNEKLQNNAQWFSGFWPSLPESRKLGIWLAAIQQRLHKLGSRWSYAIMWGVLKERFADDFTSLKNHGILDESSKEIVFRSKLLSLWAEREALKNDTSNFFTIALKKINRNRDKSKFTDYAKWVGVNPPQNTKENTPDSKGNKIQRVIGWIMLITALWAFLHLLGVV